MVEFKEKFKERYKEITDLPTFLEWSAKPLKKCIRINTLKIDLELAKERLGWLIDEQVPWCDHAFWVKNQGYAIGNLIEHGLGYFYMQEAASIIPPLVLKPQPGELILDSCAAPGSKTTQIAQYMNNEGVLIANDIRGDRLAALGMNLQRMGVHNAVVIKGKAERIKERQFDRILVDAPCSATGAIRKSVSAARMWNPNVIKGLSAAQKKLAIGMFDNLKPGGVMVYSTCSVDPQENEEVVTALLEKRDQAVVQDIDLPGLKRPPVVTSFLGKEYHPDVKKTIRLWPQDNDTEGFYISLIKKEE